MKHSTILLMAAAMTAITADAAGTESHLTETAPAEMYYYMGEADMEKTNFDNPPQHIPDMCFRISYAEGKAYLYNFFSVFDPKNAYIETDIIDNKIILPTGWVYTQSTGSYGQVSRFCKDSEGNWGLDATNQDVVFNIAEDGTITEDDPETKFGLMVFFNDDDLAGYEYPMVIYDNLTLKPVDIQANEPGPDATFLEYHRGVEYAFDETELHQVITAARDGNNYYFKNLYDDKGQHRHGFLGQRHI